METARLHNKMCLAIKMVIIPISLDKFNSTDFSCEKALSQRFYMFIVLLTLYDNKTFPAPAMALLKDVQCENFMIDQLVRLVVSRYP